MAFSVTEDSVNTGLLRMNSTVPSDIIIHDSIVQRRNDLVIVPVTIVSERSVNLSSIRATILPVESTLHLRLIGQSNFEERKNFLAENIRLGHLSDDKREQLFDLLWKYNDVIFLPGDSLEKTVVKVEFQINTKPGPPAHAKLYCFPPIHKEEVNKQIRKYLRQGIVKNSTSPWNAPVWVFPKQPDADGERKWRIVIDYHKLNTAIIEDEYPLPNISDTLDYLGNAKLFTTLDLTSGFRQIPVVAEHQEKTAFSTPTGHYEFTRMPYGVCNAPRVFQRIINNCLQGLLGAECFVYVDDIIIHADSFQTHQLWLQHVFNRLRQNGFVIQPVKCEFARPALAYLGHIISEKGLLPMPDKLEKIRKFPAPQNIKQASSSKAFSVCVFITAASYPTSHKKPLLFTIC